MLANAVHEQLLHILVRLGDQINVTRLANKILPCLIVARNQLFKRRFLIVY